MNAETTSTNQMIMTAAIASVGATAGMTLDDYQRRIVKRAATIQRLRLLDEEGLGMRVLDSVKLRAVVKSVAFEESSQRYVITYVPQNKETGEEETIRTPRIDSRDGIVIEPLVARVKDCAGTDRQVIVYKHNEQPTEEAREAARKAGRNIPAAGYRTAVWFEVLD